MASFSEQPKSQFQILGEMPDTITLLGNLQPADESKLTPAFPKDLESKEGYTFLIYDRDTYEKIIGSFKRVDTIYDIRTNDSDLDVEHFSYVFETDRGELFIESKNQIENDYKAEYNRDMEFNPKFGVFIPQSQEIISRQLTRQLKLPPEIQVAVANHYKFYNKKLHETKGGKSRKSRKSRKIKKI